MKLLHYTLYAALIFLMTSSAGDNGAKERAQVADNIANNLAKKNYATVRKDFAKIMLDALSEDKIKANWEDFTGKLGEFKEVVSTKEVEIQGYKQIQKRCRFANENGTLKVTFNEENKVIGLFLTL